MEAPPGDLAISYLNAKVMVDATALAQSGVQIITPEGEVNSNNSAKIRKKYEARQQLYGDAMARRGFSASLGGSYRVQSAGSTCGRSYSTLLAGAAASEFRSLSIWQQGADIKLTAVSHPPAGSPPEYRDISQEFIGATVENVVALVDPWNSIYMLEGTFSGNTIEWRARPEVLRFWPQWAPGPTAADIAECRVVLERID